MKVRTVAIVPAAGLGIRFGSGTRKPFTGLCGKPVLIWVLEALEASSGVSEVLPVVREEDMEDAEKAIQSTGLSKVRRLAPGGMQRQDSVLNGLRAVEDASCTVLVHDGARPLVTPSIVAGVLGALEGYDGAVSAVPVKDTVKEAGEDSVVRRTIPRDCLWAVHTPQAFPYGRLMDAHLAASRDGVYMTDDAALVERDGGRIRIVMGSYSNIKITTPEDLAVAGALMSGRAVT